MAGLLACCFGGPEPGPVESEVKSEAVAAVAAAASKVPAAAQPKEAATPKPPGVPVAAPEPEPEPEEPEEALAMVEEPACGHLYPSFITAYAGAAGRPKQKLVGCGVRSKRIGGNLYTVGVYVAPAELPSDATVDTLITADLDETLRFELQSGLINEKRFLGAFDEALKGAMKAAGESDTYEAFRAGLTALTFVPKTVFLMSLAPDGTIVVTDGAGETVITTVASKKLGQLLIDLYVGPKTVAPAVKAAVAQGVAALAKV